MNGQRFENEIESLTLTISDEAMISVKKVFELAINAKELYKSMDREDRLNYLKKVCSNPTLDGLTLHISYKVHSLVYQIGRKIRNGGEDVMTFSLSAWLFLHKRIYGV